VAGNKLVAMDDFIKEDPDFGQEDLDDVFPVFIKSNTIDNRLWAFPFNKSVRVLYYNRDMLFQNDIDPYTPPATWKDFLEYCRKMTKDENKDGTPEVFGTTFPVSAWQFENLLLQAFPTCWQDMMNTYQKVTKRPFGYTVLDLHPASDDRKRMFSHLLTHEGYPRWHRRKREDV